MIFKRWLAKVNKTSVQKLEAYKATFNGPLGEFVLADLAARCCFDETTFSTHSERMSNLNEGKREIFLYILRILAMSPSDFTKKHTTF